MTGANLLDKAASSAMIAALNPDSERMNQCAADVKTVLKYSNNTNSAINSADDGFWKDGSYIQHEGIAYNGGYGAVLYQQLGVFLHMFHGSPWDFAEAYADSPVFNSIFEGVEPLLYQGHFMDMTAGRSIARQAVNDRNRASGILAALMPYVGAMPSELEDRLEGMLKYHLERVKDIYFEGEGVNTANALVTAKELLKKSGPASTA